MQGKPLHFDDQHAASITKDVQQPAKMMADYLASTKRTVIPHMNTERISFTNDDQRVIYYFACLLTSAIRRSNA